MKIEVNEHGTIVLKEVFNPIKLVTDDNEFLIITMRDSGFEICYQNDFYNLKEGKVSRYGDKTKTINQSEPKKLTKQQVSDIIEEAKQIILKEPYLRFGQTIFNLLAINYPEISEEIRGTKYDCFYVDDKVKTTLEYITQTT